MDEKRPRQTGRFPVINVTADTLGQAYHHALIACYERGIRAPTPKHRLGMPLGYDAHITVEVLYPQEEPLLHKIGYVEDERGLVQYILEVTHGIHNHWKKNPNDPTDTRWGYTYNERFDEQIPFVFAKIKNDFQKKRRVSGRDYFFSIWRVSEDSIVEQEDPPCFQNGQLRFIENDKGDLFINYLTCWRSRDEAKAWDENNTAQVRLQKLFAAKASQVLGREVRTGSYIDTSTSLHIYGAYLEEGFDEQIERMRRGKVDDFTMSYADFVEDEAKWKRIIAAQSHYEAMTGNKNAAVETLKDNGYDLDTFAYPAEWDGWPKSWDREPDPKLLLKR